MDAPHEVFQRAQTHMLWGAGPRAVVSHPAGKGRGEGLWAEGLEGQGSWGWGMRGMFPSLKSQGARASSTAWLMLRSHGSYMHAQAWTLGWGRKMGTEREQIEEHSARTRSSPVDRDRQCIKEVEKNEDQQAKERRKNK